jgi:citrate lyase subunit beta-like protein
MPREILRAAKIVDKMTRAHAVQKGAVGLELSDEKGNKEMIDAPMLKQVTPVDICIHSCA